MTNVQSTVWKWVPSPWSVLGALAVLAACGSPPPEPPGPPQPVEAISLLGDSLRRPALTPEALGRMEAQLDSAKAAYLADTTSADGLIWVGRRLAYLGRYREAIGIFGYGVTAHPDDARIYRHRGHRYITTRQLDLAIADLEQAAALVRGTPDMVEPDGQPNARNIPTSTLQSNIFYHLGLAYYLKGDFERALAAYRDDLEVSTNPDMLVASSYWTYMTLRRVDRPEAADSILIPIAADMDIIENTAYHKLLLLFKGELEPGTLVDDDGDELRDATTRYGLGVWHLVNGRQAEATETFRQIVATGPWNSFGYIAAEAELAQAR